MKLHLPVSLFKCLMSVLPMATAVFTTLTPAEAGRLHADVSMQTYTDFGQNMGRYVVGDRVNALLDYIRQGDGGVRVYYTDGTAPYTIANAQGMINFSGTGDNGAYAAIAPNTIATVLHNDSNNASFAERYVGTEHAINYSAIDIKNFSTFRLGAPDGDDYMLQRQSKIVTDAVWNPVAKVESETELDALIGQKLYHSGAGVMKMQGADGKVDDLTGAYQYIVGDISTIAGNVGYGKETVYNSENGNIFVSVYISEFYYNTGASGRTPLPNLSQGGDSGSPVYIYNAESGRYEYLAALQAGDDNTRNYMRGNPTWVSETLEGFNSTVDMSQTSVVYLNAIDTPGVTYSETVEGTTYSTTLYSGAAKAADGTTLATYNGIQSDKHTWKDLSGLKNTATWYAYDSDAYLDQSDADLFYTDNLVFEAMAAENEIILNATVDLGIGYAEFSGGKFTVKSATTGDYQFNHAGYVINEGAEVHLKFTNPDTHMTEWRKTGAGDLYIDGTGDTNVLLNLGGKGTTYLQQKEGYAAYNVLVNTGATVVIGDTGQIERDFTFGTGGGVLDMNGHSMDWYTTAETSTDDARFSINALTEEAMIHNSAGDAVLTYKEGMNTTYLGSFSDSVNGSLSIDYQGGGTWTLNSIHTDLTHNAGSGLTVSNGKVLLTGTLTRHGMGSVDGTNQDRITHSNDWHYADAAMDVTVKDGATFELGSHARLKGDVTLDQGGTYIMREGVQSRFEYVEGGALPDDTYKYADYYGHKGDVMLSGAMKVEYSAGTTSGMTYSGKISGAGSLSVDTGTAGGTLTLSGDNSGFTGTREIIAGGVIASEVNALGDTSANKWKVAADGWIASQKESGEALLGHVDAASAGTLALSADTAAQLDLSGHEKLYIGAEVGKTVHYGTSTEAMLTDSGNNWKLGGGGGTLVVDALLTGENKNLLLGAATSSSGTVVITNEKNDFSGRISLVGNGIILKATGEALGNATMELHNGSSMWALDGGVVQRLTTDSDGLLLVNELGDKGVDLSRHQSLFLGASEDVTYSGNITLGAGGEYRFSAVNGATLTVAGQLQPGCDLLVDARGHSGNTVKLAGSASQSVNHLTVDGEITLALGQHAEAAGNLTVGSGASLDLAGHSFSLLGTTSINGRVVDTIGGGELAVNVASGSQTITDADMDIDHFRKTGAGTLVLNSAETHADTYYVTGGTLQLGDTQALNQEDNFILSGGATLNVGTRGINFNITTEEDAGTVNLYQTGVAYTTPFAEKHTNYTIVSGNITTQGNSELRFTGEGVYELRSNEYGGENGTLSIANKQINLFATSGSDSGAVSRGVSFLGTLRVCNNATLRSLSWWDNLTHSINRLLIDEGKTLTVSESAWNTIWNLKALTGSGTLLWDSTATHTYTSRMILSGENDFSGSIILNRNNTEWGSQRTHNAIIELASDGAARNATISLNGRYNSEASLAINTENAQIRGLSGNAYSYVYAGAAPEISGGLPTTGRAARLTIDTAAGNSYTYSGAVGRSGDTAENGLSLVKTGSGSQKIAGNAWLGNLSVEAGTLELAGSTTSIAGDVSLAGGTTLSMGGTRTSIAGDVSLAGGATLSMGGTTTSIAGDVSLAGGATLSIGGTTTSIAGDVSLAGGTTLSMEGTTTSIAGDVSLTGGATLSMGSLVLSSGQTLAVVPSESGTSATFTGTLSMAGGTLAFDAKGLDEATTALNLSGDVACPSTSKLHFENYRYLKSGATYTLATGNWETVVNALNITGLRFFDRTISMNDSGHLQIAVTLSDGYVAWAGDSSVLQPENKVIFFGLGEDAAVSISSNAEVGSAIFDNENTLCFSSSNGSTLAFGSVEKTSDAALEINTGVSIGKMKVQENTSLSGSGELSVGSFSFAEGKTLNVEKGGTLAFSGATDGIANANITGEGTVGLNLTAKWENTIDLSAFEGETYVKSGRFSVTGAAVGKTLRLAGGVNMQSNASGTVSADIILEGESIVHANGDKPITYTGTVTGENGVFISNGGSSHTFDGVVNLAEFRTANTNTNTFNAKTSLGKLTMNTAGAIVNLKGETTIGNLEVTKGSLYLAGGAVMTLTGKGTTSHLDAGKSGSTVALGKDAEFNVTSDDVWLNKMTLAEGATFTKGSVTVKGLSTGASTVAADGTSKVNFAEVYQKVTNAQVISTSDDICTLASKLEGSSVENAGAGLLTVSNSANTITSLEAAGGHVKLSENMGVQSISAASGKTVTVAAGKSIAMAGGVSLGTNGADATLTAQSDNSLARLMDVTSFTIQDMALTNATLTATRGGAEVKLQNVTADNVVLSQGAFTMQTAAPSVGMAEFDNPTLTYTTGISGITDGATLTLVADPSVPMGGATTMIDLEFVFTGFRTETAYSVGSLAGLESAYGIRFGGLLGELLNPTAGAVAAVDTLGEGEAVSQASASTYTVSYGAGTGANVGSLVISISGLNVPEPATATLSLLALAALAARRRRK